MSNAKCKVQSEHPGCVRVDLGRRSYLPRRRAQRASARGLEKTPRGGALPDASGGEVLAGAKLEGGARRVREVHDALREERGRAVCAAQVELVPVPTEEAEHGHQGGISVGD